MADRLRLLSRLAERGDFPRPVAWRGAAPVLEAAFRARVAGWRSALGERTTSPLALFHSDGVEFAAALLGAWQAGLTVVIPGDDLPATCRQLRRYVARFAGEFPAECSPLAAPADGTADARFDPLAADHEGVVLHTAGSTGEPQAIAKRLRQLASEVETLDRTFGAELGEADMVATVSHQHIYGLLFKILWPLASQRAFLSRSLLYPEELADALGGRCAALVSSPAHLGRLPDDFGRLVTPARIRAVFSSGSPLSADAVALTERQLGRAPAEIYGSSETGGIAWRKRPTGADAPWTPFSAVTLRDDGGRLAVRSPTLRDGDWFTTADQVEFHADGTFTLRGRSDRIAKIEGKRVSLDALERALVASRWVVEARVFPLSDGRGRLAAVVVPSAEGRATIARDGRVAFAGHLRALLGDHAERVALPRRWRFVDALPMNSGGKTTLAALGALFRVRPPELPVLVAQERDGDRAMLTLDIPTDLAHFDGHFPGAPILPGVVLVDWAIHFGRERLGIAGEFRGMEAIKFHRVVPPGARLRLELVWRSADATLMFTFVSDAGDHSSGRIQFTR